MPKRNVTHFATNKHRIDQAAVLALFQANPDAAYTSRQCYKHLKVVDRTAKQAVQKNLQDLVHTGQVRALRKGKYRLIAGSILHVTGRVDYVHRSYAYIVTPTEDIYVRHTDLLGALHKDLVKVALIPHPAQKKKKKKNSTERAR